MVGLLGFRNRLVSFRINGFVFFSFTFEALVAGFYVVITRGVTPIFLVASGYGLKEILLINVFAGLFSLLIGFLLYKHVSRRLSKSKLLIPHVLERILWFTIPFAVHDKVAVAVLYGLAVASTLPTSVFIQSTMLSTLSKENYRKAVGLRNVLGAFSSILGQIVIVSSLALIASHEKYFDLYKTAFITGIVSSLILALVPIRSINNDSSKTKGSEDFDSEAYATNVFLLLTVVLSSYLLLSIAWTPRIMRDLGAPDYMAASIGFMQTIATIGSSFFWIRKPMRTHRYSLLSLTVMPLLVYMVSEPKLHLLLALAYGFSIVGVNMYAAKVYSELVGKISVFKAGILLASTSSLALTLASMVGYVISTYSYAVFIASAVFGAVGLALALTSIPELAVISKQHVQLYSKIIYQTTVSSYNTTVYAMSESAKTTMKIAGLGFLGLLLFVIYRTLYYMIMLTGG